MVPFPFPLNETDILNKRAQIHAALCASDAGFSQIPVSSIRRSTLSALLDLYDQAFFSGFLARSYGELTVTLSSRLTSSAGKFVFFKDPSRRMQRAEIRMSSDFLFRLKDGPFLLNGLSAATPQEAFLLVFEHELCHALETALYGESGHSSRFLALARGLFGHTETHHSLPTRKQAAAQKGIVVGMRASFLYQNRMLEGVISYIGKTATVMVADPRGTHMDKRGRRYTKYRVPLSLLKI